MDTNAKIISDFQHKIGFQQPLDFLSEWKGVPVMVTGYIQEVQNEKILFRLEPPDSICFAHDEYALILHDIFFMGIQGRILAFDLQKGIAELGKFSYLNRGFGDRATVRVEPDTPIPAELVLSEIPITVKLEVVEAAISCQVLDISLNGFGLLTKSTGDLKNAKGKAIRLKLCLLDQEIEIPGTLVGVFPKEDSLRLAMTFAQDAPNHAVIAHYIARRRAEIRQEIQTAYQEAVA